MKEILRKLMAYSPSVQYRKSYAKDQLDKRLDPFIGKRNGFFVEAGANDGIMQSNTLYFEKYFGWRGILIEPVKLFADRCRLNRPKAIVEECALGTHDSSIPLNITVAGLMSTSEGAFSEVVGYSHDDHLERAGAFKAPSGSRPTQVACKVRSLSSVLDSHGAPDIDLLSLDVEGFELQALAGLDFKKHQPQYILLEERSSISYESTLHPFYKKEAVLSFSEHYSDVLYRKVKNLNGPGPVSRLE